MRRHRATATIAATLVAGAVAATAPLAWRLGDGVPVGREGVATVPFFNLWSLTWTAQRVPHGLAGWWDAPIFWPSRGTYANSELQPLTGLAFWVLRHLASDAAAYGLLVILAVALNGWAGYRLARRLGTGLGAATVTGLLAELLPFAMQQLGVLQLLMLWPILLAIERSLAWSARPTATAAIGVGGAVAASFLTCGYHAVLFLTCALPAAVVLVRRSWLDSWRPRAGQLMIAAAVTIVVTAPFLVGQQTRLAGIRWTEGTIRDGSASWGSLAPGGHNWFGLPLVLLGLVGAVVHRRRASARFLVALAAGSSVLALGLRLSLLGWRPYALLVDHVAAFGRLRSPFRAVAIAQLALVGLAGLAIESAWRWRRQMGLALGVGALVATSVTISVGSGPIAALPVLDTTWGEWLRAHPGGAVAALPAAPGRAVEDFEPTTEAMLQALHHGHPLLNGYSGFFPSGQAALREQLNHFPDPASIATLERFEVTYVVADAAWWTAARDRAARAAGLTVVLAGPDGVLIELA